MPEPFKGVINLDIRDSVPDWTPYEAPRAPKDAPNVLMIVLDDVGYSALSCYGGLIETPNLSAVFTKTGEEPKGTAHGRLALYIDDRMVGEGRIKIQPGKFSLSGGGISVGLQRGSQVTGGYPGERPWQFTGTLKKVLVDVSGEPYVHLETEGEAMMSRE